MSTRLWTVLRIGREILSEEGRAQLEALGRSRDYDWLFDYRAWRFADLTGAEVDQLIELLLDRSICLTPTLSVARAVLMGDDTAITEPPGISSLPDDVPEQWQAESLHARLGCRGLQLGPDRAGAADAVRRARPPAGVRLTGRNRHAEPFVLPGQSMHDELELLVELGLTPMEAIVAATSRAAGLLGMADRIGTVRPGYYADLLIVRGDPIGHISATRSVRLVIKSGRIISRTSLQSRSPTACRDAAGFTYGEPGRCRSPNRPFRRTWLIAAAGVLRVGT